MAPTSAADCDLLVIGSGAGGLSAAVTAAHLGLAVCVVEKRARFGGTTAWSGGWMWIPRNPLAQAAGIREPLDAPLNYLRHELGSRFNEALARAYLENAPRMVTFHQARTALQFIDGNAIPDFHGATPDAGLGGRSVCAAPFDARRLGRHRSELEPPLPETTLWGMGIAGGTELRHFIEATRKRMDIVGVTMARSVSLTIRACWRAVRLGTGARCHAARPIVGALAAAG